MATILCTESNHHHEYTRETYDIMCMYDAIDCRNDPLFDTIPTEEDAEWWHEYERVNKECEMAAEEQGIDICHDAEFVWLVDWSDLGAAMDKIAKELGVRQMFVPDKGRTKKEGMTPSSVADEAREAASATEGGTMELRGKHL
jgi:hypothetical protein